MTARPRRPDRRPRRRPLHARSPAAPGADTRSGAPSEGDELAGEESAGEVPARRRFDGVRRRLVPVVAAVVVALVGSALAVVLTRSDDSAEGGVAEEAAAHGGVLRIAVAGLESFDPAEARDPSGVMVADFVFDTLVTYHPETTETSPGLAESWEASVDQRRFTFRLREGVTFHDGSPITAADVKATFERIAAPGSDSDFRLLLQSVTGYDAFHREQTADGLEGVIVVDERTVAVELSRPFAAFPDVLGNPGLGIVPAAAAGDESFATAPVGSGPVAFAGERDGRFVFERFDGYGPEPALVDGLELVPVDTPEEGYDLLSREEVDVAPVPADRVREARAEYGAGGFTPFMGILFYGMNLAAPEFESPAMRQAVVAAIDRERIVDVVYDGTVILARGFVPEGIPGSVENACAGRCDHDPALAQQLVLQAFPEGDVPTVSIDFDDDPVQQAVAGAMRRDLEAVGIPVELRPHEFKDYGVFLVNDQPELFRLGWTADYPSADAFLYPVFFSEEADNLTGLASQPVDEMLREARAEADPAARRELYRQVEQLVLDQYPVVPIAQFTNRWAVSDVVRGLDMSPLGTFDVTVVSLSRPAST